MAMNINDREMARKFLESLKNCEFKPIFIEEIIPAQEDDVSISFNCEAIHYHLCFGTTNIVRLPGWLADRLPERFVSHTYINCKVINES